MLKRRPVILASLAAPLLSWPLRGLADDRVAALLREGGVVLAMRHALAPGTYDPPGYRLDDCSTQRNLSEEGREQARRLGAWLRQQQLKPARVRSSPWCRCLDTARLAFGATETWTALSSPTGSPDEQRRERVETLRQALLTVQSLHRGRFEAWVTHQFVLQDLAGTSTSSAEALVLRADGAGITVLGRGVIG